MMPNIKLNWNYVEFFARDVDDWDDFRREVDIDGNETFFSNKAVYVIQIRRPYSFSYGRGHSPVAYIGKGKIKNRLTHYIETWISDLRKTIPDLKIGIFFCEPRASGIDPDCNFVQADLIRNFRKLHNSLPLRNRAMPAGLGNHRYDPRDVERVLHPGKDAEYHWAIRPL